MVVREGFFGNQRYDKILTELAIAPNIGGNNPSSPDRFEYLLTEMGGPFIARCNGATALAVERQATAIAYAPQLIVNLVMNAVQAFAEHLIKRSQDYHPH
jgi:hypothetical protein